MRPVALPSITHHLLFINLTWETSVINTINQKEITEQTEYMKFSRNSIKAKLRNKKAKRIPLVVHIFVPLCDNENQGIVPVGKSLGIGQKRGKNQT